MKAEERQFIETLEGLDRSELVKITISEHKARIELETREASNERINTEVHIQYMELKEKYDTLLEEHHQLKEAYYKEIDKNALKNRSIFGRSTEKLLSLISEAVDKPEGYEDESEIEDSSDNSETRGRVVAFPGSTDPEDAGKKGGKTPGKRSGKKNSLKDSLKNLPQDIVYQINFALLNSLIGDDVWRIVSWREHWTVERLPVTYYVKRILTPVITIGAKHYIHTMPYVNLFVAHGYASASIIADILYRKFLLGLPFYRQAMDYAASGIALSRQTIIHWINAIVPEYLVRVRDYMLLCLIRYGYIQIDETKLQVNKGGQGVHNGFMWVQSSSELQDCPPIIVFTYEATRGTDHLRRLFSEFLGYIVCDAYISYDVFAKEHSGITIAGCLMHCRRYFAEAFFVNDIEALSDDELAAMHETEVLLLIRDIYIEENKLKDLSAAERHAKRQETVRPKVDALFEYIHTLAESGELFSDRMTKAINYAINQEEKLREFLNDGNIPCDNGNSERKIRAYSVGRANWLFADTVVGADVNAVMYSLVETARANHADVRIYIQYLLERIFARVEARMSLDDPEFLASLMAWSSEYKQYEADTKSQSVSHFKSLFREFVSPPRSGIGRIEVQDRTPPDKDPPTINAA